MKNMNLFSTAALSDYSERMRAADSLQTPFTFLALQGIESLGFVHRTHLEIV